MPLESNLATPRGSIVSIDLLYKTLQNSISPKPVGGSTQRHWAVGKVAYCFWSDRTGTLVAMATYMF